MTTLKKRDGFGNTTPDRRPLVEGLQRALKKAGHTTDVDGLFGSGTERAVKTFQRSQGLETDGIVGPATWRALEPHLGKQERPPSYDHVPGFETFHGDLDWVHQREGHAGRPYWPRGSSGVTLDPGFDLGRQTMDRARSLYGPIFTAAQYRALQKVIGLRGAEAGRALKGSPVLQSARVSRAQAAKMLPFVAVRYWKAVGGKFSPIRDAETPGSVQTVILSLAYNRGANNKELKALSEPIRNGKWLKVADLVGSMQQNHELPGIRIRRRQEADLIRQELEFA